MSLEVGKQWRFTGLPIEKEGLVRGVLINFSALPTQGVDGLWRLGGNGVSSVSRIWEHLIGQDAHFDAGQTTRAVIAKQLDWEGELPDRVMKNEIARRTKNSDFEIDYAVDQAAIDFALEGLAKREVVLVSTKILQLLLRKYARKLAGVQKLMVAVDTADETATRRKRDYERDKQGIGQTTQEVRDNRARRFAVDADKYSQAYPGLVYSRDSVVNRSHVVLDNSRNREDDEFQLMLAEMFWDMARRFPQLLPSWERVSGLETESLR